MISANGAKRFFQDWKDTLTVVMAAVALLVSLRNAWRDRRVQGLQQPVLKFHVRISEYVDKDLIEKDLPISRDDRRAAMKKLTEFPIAIYVKATNEGLYPATVEYCGCLVSYPGVRRPQDAPNHSEAVVEEVKCKLGQGDSYEWAIKFRIFPYRILGIFLANSFGRMWLVDNRQVLKLIYIGNMSGNGPIPTLDCHSFGGPSACCFFDGISGVTALRRSGSPQRIREIRIQSRIRSNVIAPSLVCFTAPRTQRREGEI